MAARDDGCALAVTLIMTAEEYQAMLRARRRNKYGNEPQVVDGIRFASKREARRYAVLRERLARGEIRGLRLQVPYALVIHMKYVADFVYEEASTDGVDHAWTTVVEDAKGSPTREYVRKRRAMRDQHGITIREV